MKRAIIILIEGLGYSIGMAYMTIKYANRFVGVSILAVFLIPLMFIAIINLLQILFDTKVEESLMKRFNRAGRWIYPAIIFGTDFLIFFVFYKMLEHVGNMPASFRTLALLSVLSATVHLVLYEMLRIMSKKELLIASDQDEFGE